MWQREPGKPARTATVQHASRLGLPTKVEIAASVSDQRACSCPQREPCLRHGCSYMQISVPGLGPVLAWVGLPGGGQRDGWFIHPASGRTWPWGEMTPAVQYAVQYAQATGAGRQPGSG